MRLYICTYTVRLLPFIVVFSSFLVVYFCMFFCPLGEEGRLRVFFQGHLNDLLHQLINISAMSSLIYVTCKYM